MKITSALGLLVGISFWLTACEESKIEETQSNELVEAATVQSSAVAKDQDTFFLAVGDTVVNLAETALLQMAEIPSEAQALFVEYPDKLPMVQAVLDRYGATLERKTFSSLTDKEDYLSTYPSLNQKDPLHIKAAIASLSDKHVYLYQRPILIRRRNCASCEEPSLVDYTATEVASLRAYSSLGKPEGYEVGDFRGVWMIMFPATSTHLPQ